MKVYKVCKWFRDWTSKTDEVRFTKHYMKNRAGSTIFASLKGAKSAIAQQGRYYPDNKNGYYIEEYECTFIGEIRDKLSHQGCLCDNCPNVLRVSSEDYVCSQTENIISFTLDWWNANCPCKVLQDEETE